MSAPIFPLAPEGKTRFRTSEKSEDPTLDVYDVFNPETTDADMRRVRDAVVARANAYDSLKALLDDCWRRHSLYVQHSGTEGGYFPPDSVALIQRALVAAKEVKP